MHLTSKTSLYRLLVVAFLIGCTNDNPVEQAGNTSETGNPVGVVTGVLYLSNGESPASDIPVAIRPRNTLAQPFELGEESMDTVEVLTDQGGYYKFHNGLNPGTYVVEASNGNDVVLIDSIVVRESDSSINLGADTLQPAGALKGVIRLSEGGDPRKVFILAFGIDRFASVDSLGQFRFEGLAESGYDLRLISSLDDYGVLDFRGVAVVSADTTDLDTLELPFEGIPTPKGLSLTYDTLRQIVTLTWNQADIALVTGYNVYRRHHDSGLVKINSAPITDTTYADSTAQQDQIYTYHVKAVDKTGNEGLLSTEVAVDVVPTFAVVDSIVKGFAAADGNFGHLPRGVISSDGDYFIIDDTNRWLQKINSTGEFVFKVDTFNTPAGICLYEDSTIYVADRNGQEVLVFDYQGILGRIFSTIGRPTALARRSDTLFVASDSGIELYSDNDSLLSFLPFAFDYAMSYADIILGSDGKLFVSETRGVYTVDINTASFTLLHEIADQSHNQHARLALVDPNTLLLFTSGAETPFRSTIYVIDSDGNMMSFWKTTVNAGDIVVVPSGRIVIFSDEGKILFLE